MTSRSHTTTAPIDRQQLREQLLALGLRGIAAELDELLACATDGRSSPQQFLQMLAEVELRDRKRRSLERRQTRARIGNFKPVADFDYNWPKSIDRALLERALALGFVADGGNVLLVGAHGLGKTMLLKNIANNAVMAGHTALFCTAARMLGDLSAQDSARALERRIAHYTAPALLCIDELGYLSYDNRAADLLFEVVSRRHELRRCVALSTNLAFSDWTSVFPNATCTVALVDRLIERADIIKIEGDSWRRREAALRQQQRRQPQG